MRLVLDTNVVLDWLVFSDPTTNLLRDGVREKRVDVVTHATAVEELERVLAYAEFKLDTNKQSNVLTEYRALTLAECMPKDFSLPARFPRCRDRDDDHFLALAYWTKADALVTRDKALLKLQSRAGKFGVKIVDSQIMYEMLESLSSRATR